MAVGTFMPRNIRAEAAHQRNLQHQSVTDPQLVPTAESANHISKKAQRKQQAVFGSDPQEAAAGASTNWQKGCHVTLPGHTVNTFWYNKVECI